MRRPTRTPFHRPAFQTLEKLHSERGTLGVHPSSSQTGTTPEQVRDFRPRPYSAASRTWRALGVRIVTSSSAAVGCNAMVASKSALVAFILTAMPST
jgi:hypothetical protein